MMSEIKQIKVATKGERFYEFTDSLRDFVRQEWKGLSGVLTVFNTHTSCALTISEAYASTAKLDMENFLKTLAPRNLSFIQHKDEGEDDSPSHMKSLLLETSLNIFVEKGELVLGQWQGIYLCEFRDDPKTRTLLLRLSH